MTSRSDDVTTAPVLGQPGRAFPVVSPRGHTGRLAVPLAVVAVGAAAWDIADDPPVAALPGALS